MNVALSEMTPEMEALKVKLKATWMAGDYAYFATFMEKGAQEFLERIPLEPGMRLLDVACGSGQLAIPAARQGVKATGVDIAANSIEKARERARAEKLDASFDEGDAEDLPYEDGSFDVVVSLIGAMFAPRPELVARELKRVCKPGGRIVMGNWTPGGFVGQLFKTQGAHIPSPAIAGSPLSWGTEEAVRERFKDGVSQLKLARRMYPFDFPFSPTGVVEHFRKYYGPTTKAFASLEAEEAGAMRKDLEALWASGNTSPNGSTVVDAEYLEVVAIRG